MPYTPHQFDCKDGYYGEKKEFGGRYVPEILVPAIDKLQEAFEKYKNDPEFLEELAYYQKNWVGRPSPLIYAKNLSEKLGGAKIYLKNEGSNLTGSHKINHCLYQALLAKRMGAKRVICETGAGQHGLATAVVCAKFGFECVVHMGVKDIASQYPNVFFMKQCGAKVVGVTHGDQRLTSAVDSAMGDWITNPDSYYLLGSALGPAPYPEIMREAQKFISKEIKEQLREAGEKLPNKVIACVGGGSNAVGTFNEFLYDEEVGLIGVEAGGYGVDIEGGHASRIDSGEARMSVMEGFKSWFLLDENGQAKQTSTISAGLNFIGIGPLHGYLNQVGRLQVTSATDQEALDAFQTLAKTEGLIVAIESAHAVVEAIKQAPKMSKDEVIVATLSGRGDNYLFNIAKGLKDEDFKDFCARVDY